MVVCVLKNRRNFHIDVIIEHEFTFQLTTDSFEKGSKRKPHVSEGQVMCHYSKSRPSVATGSSGVRSGFIDEIALRLFFLAPMGDSGGFKRLVSAKTTEKKRTGLGGGSPPKKKKPGHAVKRHHYVLNN